MIVYNAKDWLGFIFKIHKSDTVRKLWPAILFIGFAVLVGCLFRTRLF